MYKEILRVTFQCSYNTNKTGMLYFKKKVSNEVSSFLFYVPTAKRQAGELSTNVLRNDAVLALVTFLFRFGP